MNASQITRQYLKIKKQIKASAQKVNRDEKEIHLVAVTKTRTLEEMQVLVQNGMTLFGENKVQEVLQKQEFFCQPQNKLHFIGHLQTNKVAKLMPFVDGIHSIDSLKLLEKIYDFCEQKKKFCDCFLQVNIANEESKHGFDVCKIKTIVKKLKLSKYLKYSGLMNIAPRVVHAENNREIFRKMALLLKEISSFTSCGTLNLLSMGMSQDYPVAIEEGANYIRLGTILFEE